MSIEDSVILCPFTEEMVVEFCDAAVISKSALCDKDGFPPLLLTQQSYQTRVPIIPREESLNCLSCFPEANAG